MIRAQRIQFGIKLLTSILLVLLVIREIRFHDILILWETARLQMLFFSLFLVALNLCLATLRWRVLMTSEGPRSYLPLFKLLMISHAYNMFVPGSIAGDVYRAVKTGAATIVMDRLVGLMGMILLWILGLAFSFSTLSETGLFPYLVGLSLFLCGSTGLLLSRRLSRRVRWIGRLAGPFKERLKEFVVTIQEYRHDYRKLALSLLLTLATHFLLITATFFIALSLQTSITFFNCLLFVPIIGLLSSLPLTVGGLGLREASFVLLFSSVGIRPEISLGVSLLFYLILLILAFFGLACTFLPSKSPSPKTDLSLSPLVEKYE